MNKKNTETLLKRYPKLYRQFYSPMSETCMCWGFECQDGWFNIINVLSLAISKIDPEAEATQVKEKYGTLRFYVATTKYDDEITDLCWMAENETEHICEICGNPGKNSDGPWYSVRCDKCREKEESPKNGEEEHD